MDGILIVVLIFVVSALVRAAASQKNAAGQAPSQQQAPFRPEAPQYEPRRYAKYGGAEAVKSKKNDKKSGEGFVSEQGQCIEENPQHCAVPHVSEEKCVQTSQLSEMLGLGDSQAALKGIVWAEILKRPQRR